MKTPYSTSSWLPLYFLVGVCIAGLVWEEKLQMNPSDHTLMAVGILLFVYLSINRWISRNGEKFLDIHDSEMPEGRPVINIYLAGGEQPEENKQ